LDQTGFAGLAIFHNPGERHGNPIPRIGVPAQELETNVMNRLSIVAGLDEIKHYCLRIMSSLRGRLNLSNSQVSYRSNYFRINGF